MKKVLMLAVAAIMSITAVFADTYEQYLAKAKSYEAQKKWCYALGAYYDAMATDGDPESKQDACDGYNELKDLIVSGNPGKGTYNIFTLHDEWKNLLIDAEKYGSSITKYELEIGNLVQGDIDYATRTASYSASINKFISSRYDKTINVIKQGYSKAYKTDWSSDLPKPDDWPENSVSTKKNTVYNVDGALVFFYEYDHWWYGIQKEYKNAFEATSNNRTLYDYKFNIVDESGKVIATSNRFLLGTDNSQRVTFEGIAPDDMATIDSGKAFVKPVAVYLEYGKYNSADDNGGRTFIKNFPEVSLDLDMADFSTTTQECSVKTGNVGMTLGWKEAQRLAIEEAERIVRAKELATGFNFVAIPGRNYSMSVTEVTQIFYEAVMGENPSNFRGDNLPVEKVSWYDAIYFCNRLSELCGKTPVYSVNGSLDVQNWNYVPNKGKSISGTITQNLEADGYRLPTENEWEYAAKSGQSFAYSGSNNLNEVGWYRSNSGNQTHPVAQKLPNDYGLYDMSGNVWEWCWDARGDNNRCNRGGGCFNNDNYCEVSYRNSSYAYNQSEGLGFRIVRLMTEEEKIAEEQRLEAERIAEEQRLEAERIAEEQRLEAERIAEEQRLAAKRELISAFFNANPKTKFVTVGNQFILSTEVTQDLYEIVMGENPSYFKGGNLPVECVSWYDAIYFCNELSKIQGKEPVYSVNGTKNVSLWNYVPHKGERIFEGIKLDLTADGYRLPTAAEWEYAAMGGKNYTYSGGIFVGQVAWYSGNSGYNTHEVATKKPNGYGLYDMSGNVWEWCWGDNGNRCYRGGGYSSDDDHCEVSYRSSYFEYYQDLDSYIGFRIVCSASN